MRGTVRQHSVGLAAIIGLGLIGCDDTEEPSVQTQPFALQFVATAEGAPVGCTDTIEGLGPDGAFSVGVSDLRFYVSNLRFEDASGNPVPLALDSNDFQLTDDAGTVAMIDLTGTSDGTCGNAAIAFPEGTARTNPEVVGTTAIDQVARVRFDVGVPQDLMRSVIAENTEEAAPSPLNEMFWSWASGYRHFVFNFAVMRSDGEAGDGYLHVGSRDCGPADGKALSDRDACSFVNTPQVVLEDFDLVNGRVQIDLTALLAQVSFVAPIYDPETFEVIGEGPGVACHSSPMEADCGAIFGAFGLDMMDGSASAAANQVIKAQ